MIIAHQLLTNQALFLFNTCNSTVLKQINVFSALTAPALAFLSVE